MSETSDRILEITGFDDPNPIVDVLAEHDHQHQRAVASAMGLDPDDENLEETLAEAFAAFRDFDSQRTRLLAGGDKLAMYVGTSTSSAARRNERHDTWAAAQDWSRVADGVAGAIEAADAS